MTPDVPPKLPPDVHTRGEVGAGRITTHVLDTATGAPAAGLELELNRREGGGWQALGRYRTDAAGRCGPLLAGAALRAGTYEIVFHVADWRQGAGFYDAIPIRFVITDPSSHHHVPLILSPFGYSTYRGS